MNTSQRPNILVFFVDQQRWDTCGCYGQPLNITPNLDRMADNGTRFRHAFTCQPVCGPARAAIMTGRYPSGLGCSTNNLCLPLDARTIAHHLSDTGYEVGYLGKWHLASHGGEDTPRQPRFHCATEPVPEERRGGFKDFWLASDILEFTSHSYDGHMFDADGRRHDFPEGRYRVDAQTDWLIEYLRTRDGKQPFFMFCSYIEPHQQNDTDCYEAPHGLKERFANFIPPGDLKDCDGKWKEQYPGYLGCINSLDTNLGRVREELERLDLTENTIIIYASDHGTHFRTRNKEYKRSCHEASIRIPMIISGPGFEGGQVIDRLVSLIDLPPTLLRMADCDEDPGMHGAPLQDAMTGESWPKEVFLQISESHVGRTIRTKDWKYSVRSEDYEDPDLEYVEDFLYDLNADPHEQNNLIQDPAFAKIREELADTLKRRIKAIGEPDCRILPNKGDPE